MKRTTETRVCHVCSKPYHPQYGRPNQRYCSRECYRIGRWGKPEQPTACLICGKPCTSTGSRKQKYCSWDCAQKGKAGRPNPKKSNRKTKTCEWCGKRFSRPVADFHGKRAFCSMACHHEWRSEHIRGPAHPRWCGGSRSRANGKGWKAARRKALRKANHSCERCSVPSVTVHHKIPVRCFAKPYHAHYDSNLIVVCPKCHGNEERKSRTAMKTLGF